MSDAALTEAVAKSEWLMQELHLEREMRRKALAQVAALEVDLQKIGATARAAVSSSPQPTSSMVALHDMRFECDFLRGVLRAISEMAGT